jgi:hypothetical protein
VASLPRGERRGRLAADLLAAHLRSSAFQSPVGDESGRAARLFAIAEEDPPQDPRWRPIRAAMRAGILMREAAESRLADPVAALRELDGLEADAAGQPGPLAMIRVARTALTMLRGLVEGDISVFADLRGDMDQYLAAMAAGRPEAERAFGFLKTAFEAMADQQHGGGTAEAMAKLETAVATLGADDPLRQVFEESKLLVAAVEGGGPDTSESPGTLRAKLAETAALAQGPDLNDDQRAHYHVAAAATALRASWVDHDVALVDASIEHHRAALERTAPGHRQLAFRQLGLAMAFNRRNELTGDLDDLRDAADALDQARETAQGPQDPSWMLINQMLGQIGPRLGDDRARDAPLDGMRNLAWKVLLQSDTAAARAAARDGAEYAADTARASLSAGDPAAAARALDSGRALMLFAATEFRDVGPRLVRAGRDDLAERWRRAQEPGGRDRMPTGLRGEVLGVLAEGSGLLDPPPVADIQTALRRLDADALVYLVPGGDKPYGMAVMVPAEGPAAYTVLPDLHVEPGRDASRYLDRLARRETSGDPGGETSGETTRDMSLSGSTKTRADTLDALCRWAWDVAVGPIVERYLPALPEPAGRPRRLILVPSGRLALVPWQAARRGDGVFAVELAAFSLTASARMLCRAASAPPVPLAPVGLVVGDPDTGDPDDQLAAARVEAYAVHQAFYRGGRYLGTRADGKPSRAGAGTADEVRAWLTAAGPAAGPVLHLACHGAIDAGGDDPTAYLLLAGGDRITADEIVSLMASAPRREVALAVLAACHTAESVHGYDEAYSLGTALLAGGVRSVLSTQWAVPDEATSVLMFMVHHFLMAEGLPVWAALRRAQLWMLDPGRVVPPNMPGALRDRMAAADLARIEGWAGFVHQGR